jgi:hypothetical protein
MSPRRQRLTPPGPTHCTGRGSRNWPRLIGKPSGPGNQRALRVYQGVDPLPPLQQGRQPIDGLARLPGRAGKCQRPEPRRVHLHSPVGRPRCPRRRGRGDRPAQREVQVDREVPHRGRPSQVQERQLQWLGGCRGFTAARGRPCRSEAHGGESGCGPKHGRARDLPGSPQVPFILSLSAEMAATQRRRSACSRSITSAWDQ